MKIKTIDIDGFGVWNGLKIDDLADSATVVYGPNEAGKTTLMQFVRAVLYGFTPERRKKYLPPVNGGKPGGRLLLADAVGQYLAHRTAGLTDLPDDAGPLVVIDDRGENRDPAKVDDLLAGVDEPTYNNVFAIGLKEIQELGSLDETAAADYLYKLTSGLDRVSLIDVIRETTAARERLLASDEKESSRLPELLFRRRELKAKLEEHAAARNRWCDVATLRATLAEEAAQFERQIKEIEHASHVLRAALDLQPIWNLRADILRQLDLLKDVRQLPEKAVDKLDACLKRIGQCRERMRKLVSRRNRYRKDLESLQVNRVLLSHASRIEALHDQSQWISGLSDQLTKLRGEVKKLDDEIDVAVNGFSKSAGNGSLDELPADTVSVLRRPAQVMREENDKLEKIKAETDQAKRDLDAAIEQYQTVGLTRNVPDLNQAIQETGHKVSLLRKRIQIEERVDQLSRRREELEFDGDELHSFEEMPMRVTALIGMVFAAGIALTLFGLVGGANNWVASGMPWTMFGILVAGGAIGFKLLADRHSEDNLTSNHRHLEQHRLQLSDAKRERDELDSELPAGNGSLDARLREAEIELRDLERLIPIRTEREQALAKHQAAQRRLAAAQDAVKEARHRWKNALRSVGLPEDFAPMKVKQVVKSNAGVLELRRRRDARKDELDQKQREMMLLNNRVQQIIDDVKLSLITDQPLVKIRELVNALTKEKETLELRASVERKLRRLVKEKNKTVMFRRKAERRRQALLTLAGVNDDKGFRKAAADAERAAELRRQHAEQTGRIQQQLAGQHKEEAIAAVFQQEGRDIRPHWDLRQKELAEIRSRLAQIHERRGALMHEMQALAADKSLSHTLQEVASVEREFAAGLRRWKVLTIIGQVLEAVRQHYETDRQPQTLREASEYLLRLTGGHYVRVWMPLDHRNLLVQSDKGESLSLDVLSRGTREAVFIALRLALVTSFARRGTMLPLVLDDVLVNFDSGRVRAAADVLCDFARTGHQLIMFTCHEHITDIFEDASADIRVLPHRGEEVDPRPVNRRRKTVVELPPPPPPTVVPEPEPEPLRFDPNPLFLQAGNAENLFDDTPDVPKKEKEPKKRKPTSRYKIVPRDWNRDAWPLAAIPASKPITLPALDLPDFWPVAPQLPTPAVKLDLPSVWPVADVLPAPEPDTFELYAFRCLPEAWPVAELPAPPTPQPEPQIRVVAPAEPTPLQPKYIAARSQRPKRFTWESPEMYWEEEEVED